MIIVEGRKFVHKPFDSEEELERVVFDNAEYLFGSASIYFPKTLISTRDGAGTIPDGYVIDLARRVWYIVEAAVKDDLREWVATLRIPVKLWIVRKHVEFGRPENVMYEIPEEFGPVVDTAQYEVQSSVELARYDVSVMDLINDGMLQVGQRLQMPYKPRNGEQRIYEGTICGDGSIEVLGKQFSSPSYAAVFGIQDAGSDRKTVNGWISWRTDSGELLSSLRESYLGTKN